MSKIKNEINTFEKGINWVNEYNDLLTKAQSRKKELYKQVSLYDLQEQDILHYIENKKCDAVISAKLMKKLKEIRIERRVIKEELSALDSITACSKKSKFNYNVSYAFKTDVITDLLEDIINE